MPRENILAKRDEGTIALVAESIDPDERETEVYDHLISVRHRGRRHC